MLKITINTQEVDLGDLSGIELQMNGGIFEFDTIVGSYSIPFSLPVTPRNNAIFNSPSNLNSADNTVREFDCEIWHSGLMIVSGKISASEFTDTEFSCSLFVDNGYLYSNFKDKMLNEHRIGEEYLSVDMTKVVYDTETDLFVLYPVYNQYFFKNQIGFKPNNGQNHLQNRWNFDTNKFHLANNMLTPFPLLHQTLKFLFLSFGFNYVDNFFTGIYKNINIFSIHSTQSLTGPGMFNLCEQLPTMTISEFIIAVQNYFNIFFMVKNGKVTVVNRNDMMNSLLFDDYTDKKITGHSKTLSKKKSGFILSVKKDENDTLIKSIADVAEIEDSNIYLSLPVVATLNKVIFVDGFIYIGKTTESSPDVPIWVKQVSPEAQTMVQTITVIGSVTGIQGFVGYVYVEISGEKVTPSPYEILVEVALNDTDVMIAQKIRAAIGFPVTSNYNVSGADANIIITQKVGNIEDTTFNISYKAPFITGLTDVALSVTSFTNTFDNSLSFASQNSYFDGARETEINLGITPLSSWGWSDDYIPYLKNIPWVEMIGNRHSVFGSSKNKCGLRLSIYKGLQNGVSIYKDGLTYADNFPWSHQGFPSDTYYISAKGSYENHWKSFLPWFQDTMTEEFEMEINLSVAEIKNFDFSRKKLIGNNFYFIKSFSVQLTKTEILPVKCILIKGNR